MSIYNIHSLFNCLEHERQQQFYATAAAVQIPAAAAEQLQENTE